MERQTKKRFGQNFIRDQELIRKIVGLLGEKKESLVIEIGPGLGALTKPLLEKFQQVVVVEIDRDLVAYLKQNFTQPNLEIISEDILKIDFKNLLEKFQQPGQDVLIISNLPYYITSEILFKTFKVSQEVKKAVFMVQKEVGQRICADENENNYNNLSVAAKFYATRKFEFLVLKSKFRPVPQVDSAVISLTFHQQYLKQVKNETEFLAFVRRLFQNRRKTILNNLTNLTKNKAKASEILNQVKINSQLRPENLSLDDFLALFNVFQK